MMRAFVMAAFLALGACSTDSEPSASSPAPPPAAATPANPAPEPASDTCGAAQYQTLVGKPRSEIPVPVDPRKQRVACASCPITMDFNPERVNFFFDAQTGLIKEVRCG